MIKKIVPKDKAEWLALRKPNVNSTEVAALFACSPYCTPFELWHRKKDQTDVDIEVNERMKWGLRLEKAIADGVAEEHGWSIKKIDHYMFDDELKLGASFDFEVTIDGVTGILEVKNVDNLVFKNDWLENDDGTIEATPQIEVQIQNQLLVSGYPFAIVAALVGGNNPVLIRREPDPVVIDAIRAKVREFWVSIEANKPPAPDFSADAEFISKLYGYAEVGKVFDASGDTEIIDLALKHKQFTADEKKAKEGKEAIKAQLLMKIGESEKVICDGFSISCGAVAPTRIEAYDKAGFRMFRLNWPKAKKGE